MQQNSINQIKSRGELELSDFITSLGVIVLIDDISIIQTTSLSLYLPEHDLAIEYAGLYWHSDKFHSDINYHMTKYLLCKAQGIHLVTIFEDEWIHKKTIVKSVLSYMVGQSIKGIPARKTTIREVPSKDAMVFMDQHHLQGKSLSTTHLGAYHDGQLIAVMSFGNPTRQHSKGIELKRFVTDGRSHPGVAGKLFQHYVREFKPDRIISFSDHRWFTGGIYETLGFIPEDTVRPDYSYTKGTFRHHKSGFRKDCIKTRLPEHYDPELTEREMMNNAGYNRIHDCGKTRWVWTSKA